MAGRRSEIVDDNEEDQQKHHHHHKKLKPRAGDDEADDDEAFILSRGLHPMLQPLDDDDDDEDNDGLRAFQRAPARPSHPPHHHKHHYHHRDTVDESDAEKEDHRGGVGRWEIHSSPPTEPTSSPYGSPEKSSRGRRFDEGEPKNNNQNNDRNNEIDEGTITAGDEGDGEQHETKDAPAIRTHKLPPVFAPTANAYSFEAFCALLEKVARVKGSKEKREVLKDFFNEFRRVATNEESIFPIMRLLMPQYDKSRSAYGLKEQALVNVYIRLLNMNKGIGDGEKLVNWKKPDLNKGNAGDLPAVFENAMIHRCAKVGSLNIKEVNEYLDLLSKSYALKEDKAEVRDGALRALLRGATASQHKWLLRIIFKDLNIGAGEKQILPAFHEQALDFFKSNYNLFELCQAFRDPNVKIAKTALQVFNPFQPMLAEKARDDIEKHIKAIKSGHFFVETKYDGDRILLHKKGDVYKYFSRKCNDFTKNFGDSPMCMSGSHAKHMHACFDASVDECILDGEMVAYDLDENKLVPKGYNVDVKNIPSEEHPRWSPCYFVFDVLLLNGENLTSLSLTERLDRLRHVFRPKTGIVQPARRKICHSVEEFMAEANHAIENCEEGLVLKNPDSFYVPDSRKDGWLKWKPEYLDLGDDVDVLIIGGFFGEGRRRSGRLSHFMCAVAETPSQQDAMPTTFLSFCKVGTGYSLKELEALHRKLHGKWKNVDPKLYPPDGMGPMIRHGLVGKEQPDQWIEPHHSLIVQIKAAAFVETTKYAVGRTLRFPRLEKFRTDKAWFECMNSEQLEELAKRASQSLSSRSMTTDDIKRKEVAPRVHFPRAVALHFRSADLSGVEKQSQLFAPHEFCVRSGDSANKLSKADLERLIHRHGGSFVQNPSRENTSCVIAERSTDLTVQTLIARGYLNVLHPSWLLESIEKGFFVPFSHRHVLHANPQTKALMSQDMDQYGDSYFELTGPDELLLLATEAQCSNPPDASEEELFDLEENYELLEFSFLRLCRVYVDMFRTVSDPDTLVPDSPLRVTALKARLFGAEVTDIFDGAVTHVIVDPEDRERVAQFHRANEGRLRRHARLCMVVAAGWVDACEEEQTRVEERQYFVK